MVSRMIIKVVVRRNLIRILFCTNGAYLNLREIPLHEYER